MAGTSYSLDFLLVVENGDHSIIKQTPDDSSRFNNGSFYGDIKNLPIIKASLIGKGHILSVDLLDGHVETDGRKLYPPSDTAPAGIRRQLIYYRTVQQSTTMMGESKGRFLSFWGDRKDQKPKVKYFIGWQCNYRGKNCKWEMGIE